MRLAHDLVGPAEAVAEVWFLHGILGSRRNWRTFARAVVDALPGWRAVLVDLRGHGDSHPADPPHTVARCIDDVVELAALRGVPRAVVGHSFGGKVALGLSARGLAGLARAWSLDASPGPFPRIRDPRGHEVARVVGALAAMTLPLPSRESVRDALLAEGFSPAIAAWMTTNVERDTAGGYRWRFDLDVVRALLEDYAQVDAWPWIEAAGDVPRLLRAGASDRWEGRDADGFARLHPAGRAVVLPDAGHWVHVDQPAQLAELLVADFRRLVSS